MLNWLYEKGIYLVKYCFDYLKSQFLYNNKNFARRVNRPSERTVLGPKVDGLLTTLKKICEINFFIES